MADSVREIAVEAYTFLYPLVLMDVTRRQMTNVRPGEREGRGPADSFTHVRAYPIADFRDVVRPNFDTLYSLAWLDLRSEPRIVTAPATGGRYYLLEMLDMWTDAFAVPGSRTTGTGAGVFAVTSPGWTGDLPPASLAIEAPTPYVWIVGRTQTNGPADYDAVHKIQDGFTVTPLSAWGKDGWEPPAPIDPTVDGDTEPLRQVAGMDGRTFFTYASELMRLHPPHHSDWSQLARIARVGLVAGQPLDWDALPPDVRQALGATPATVLPSLAADAVRTGTFVNGWSVLREPVGVWGNAYKKRAGIALIGVGALEAKDAVYPVLVVDADGQALDGASDYVLHFDAGELPPAGAFWSVTMYDGEGFQVANELDRFAIGDRDPLVYNPDGSLDLYIQRSNPGAGKTANWLPSVAGPLGITMRIYAPMPPAVDGSWNPPPIRKV